jgi:hypothetical protein
VNRSILLPLLVTAGCLLLPACASTKVHERYHEYVVVERGRDVRHHHHHQDGRGGRKTYHVYEVSGTDGDHVHHHYVELTPKQESDLRALHDKKHAEHHGHAVKATKTHAHQHSR